MKHITRRIILCAAVFLSLPAMADAEDIAVSEGWRLRWNPGLDLYPPYAADPRRSRHIMSIARAMNSDLPAAGDWRWALSIGGEYGIARLFRESDPKRGWQFGAEARFYTQFDIDHDLDEIGHDGRLGAVLVKGLGRDLALRVTFHHTSSHVGDEYLLRNDIRERLSVRKEELSTGVSWKLGQWWRTYAEAGYGLNLGVRNEPLRLQTGIEVESWPILANGHWYAGLDLTSFQENDFEISTNLQTGIVFPFGDADRWYRFGIELYDGRAQLDSFFLFHETYLVVGVWLDL